MTKRFFGLGWRWWTAIVAVAVVGPATSLWWFGGSSDPENFTLDDAEKMCVTATRAGLDSTGSDIDSPIVEERNSEPPGIRCFIDVNVGRWYLDAAKKISLTAGVRTQVFADASETIYGPENFERNCEDPDEDVIELQGHTTCFSRHTGGSFDEDTTPRRVIESSTQIRNIDLHMNLTATSSAQNGGLAEFEPDFDELLDEIHAEMLAAAGEYTTVG